MGAALAEGDDAGYHLPGSAVWAVHGDMPTIVAGIRALLMQALHPGALAGVHDHSRFREDPLGRLAGTIRWIFTVSYGSTDAARAASDWVLRLHESVRGRLRGRPRRPPAATRRTIPNCSAGSTLPSPMPSSPPTSCGARPIPGGPDAYVREWAQAGRLMGVEAPPLSEAEMRQQLDHWYDDGELRCDERVAETVAFIRDPPLHPALRPGYRVLFAAAVTSLEPKYRELLGLRTARLGPIPLPVTPGHPGDARRRASCPGPGGPERAGCPGPAAPAGLPGLSAGAGRGCWRGRSGAAGLAGSAWARRKGDATGRKKAPVRGTGANRGEWGI